MHKISYLGFAAAILSSATPAAAADDAAVSILAGLGLTAASGKTETADGAGALEGTALTVAPVRQAGEIIRKRLPDNRIILVAGDQKVQLTAYHQATARLERLKANLVTTKCPPQAPVPDYGVKASAATPIKTGAVDVAAAMIGALKVDTSLKGYEVSGANALLVNAIAAPPRLKPAKEILLPDEISGGNYDGTLGRLFNVQARAVEDYATCVAQIAKPPEAMKSNAAAFGAVIDSLTASKDGAPSLLEAAILQEPLAGADTYVLRVDAMKTGGNIIIRSNIFLQFGFPGAVRVRGGIVANWRLSDPKDGRVVAAGTVTCLTTERDFNSISHRATKKTEIWCDPPT